MLEVKIVKTWIPIALLLALLLGACSGGASVTQAPAPGAEPDNLNPPTEAVPTVVSSDPTEAVPAEEPTAAEPAPSPQPTATIQQGLRASDPTNVNLASGKPTLVEFFAFW